MQLFRKVIFWAHLATGVLAGLVVLVMSVTGVLLTYEKQMLAWADLRAASIVPPSADAPRLGPEALLERVRKTEEGTPTAVTWRARPDAPVQVAYGREKTVLANPYTGEVVTGATGARAFFRKVTDWHRWLGASGESRETGKMITGASNLGFLFLVLSGFYLWWPRTWTLRALRNVTWFRRGLRPKARDFNWHNVIGFWSAVPLAVIVASAVVISYPWASNLVYRVAGEAPPPPQGGPGGSGGAPGGGGRGGGEGRGSGGAEGGAVLAGVDPLWAQAQAKVAGWRIFTMQVPKSPEADVVFNLDRGSGGQPQKRAQLTLERGTGREVKWEPFAKSTPGRKLRSILRFAHTGEVAGLPGQTIAGLVSLGAAVLVWTGIALAWRRLREWRGRSRRPARGPRIPARAEDVVETV